MQRTIGSTGITVNAIGFGAWQLSNVNRPPEDHAIEVVRRALDGGADLIDTADSYCHDDNDFGHNERLVNKALETLGRKAHVTVATKVGLTRPAGAWVPNGSPEYVKRRCDESLERLEVDCIALYQLHAPDPDVPIEDTVGALAELKSAGKVRHIGLSNVDLDQLERARGVARIETVQNRCNPWARDDVDSGLIERCGEMNITYLPFQPVGGDKGHRACASNPVLQELAAKYQVSPYRLLIRWLLSLGDNVLPIPGATRVESILDSLRSADVEVAPADLERIGAAAQ